MCVYFRFLTIFALFHSSTCATLVSKDVDCGLMELNTTDNKIVPWAASIHFFKGNEKFEIAASIISPFHLLTVANVFVKQNNKNQSMYEFYPSENYSAVIEATNQTYKVSRIIPYRYFNLVPSSASYLSHNDFALVHLAEEIQFVPSLVWPVCIPTSDPSRMIHVTDQLGLSGWGNGGRFKISRDLEWQKLKVLKVDHCQATWLKRLEGNATKYVDRVCAYKIQRKDEIDCISNDNGVFMERGGKFYIVGFANHCFSIQDSIYFIHLLHNAKIKWIKDSISCGKGRFPCVDGKCKNMEELCDQNYDCEDELDESPAYCRGSNPCPDGFFGCGVYGKCIPYEFRCDNHTHCENGEDEDFCPNVHQPQVQTNQLYSEFNSSFLDTNKPLMLTSIASILLLFILLLIFMHQIFKKLKTIKQIKNDANLFKAMFEVEDSGSFKIELSNLKIDKNPKGFLGEGNFGKVFKGLLKNEAEDEMEVAVKYLKVKCIHIKIEFEHELKNVMRIGRHENIANFIGYTRDKNLDLHLIYELCNPGNLENFLSCNSKKMKVAKSKKGKFDSYKHLLDKLEYTEKDMVRWAMEIANGMAFLARQKVIHRDLATRNILLNEMKIAKITDFGRSAELYKKKYLKDMGEKARAIPIRWMAVECIQDYMFTLESDVWSYGVCLWEIFSRGQTPYNDVDTIPPKEFVQKIKRGLRPDMDQVKFAPTLVQQLMTICWELEAKQRPSFENILLLLKN